LVRVGAGKKLSFMLAVAEIGPVGGGKDLWPRNMLRNSRRKQ
jgi:hypothetical protein